MPDAQNNLKPAVASSNGDIKLSRGRKIAFSLITLAGLLIFAEASLQLFYRARVGRWLWEWWAIPIYAADPVRVYKLKPNLDYWHKTREFTAHYLTDSNGMRIAEGEAAAKIPKPKDVYRVLALGPSFAFGWGVNYDDCYMRRIVAGLHVPGKRVELVNLGTPSQPISYQFKWLRKFGNRYQPDLIVQTVYGDDFLSETDDTLPDYVPSVRNGYLQSFTKMTPLLWVKSLRRYSALIFYVWNLKYALFDARAAPGDGREFYRKPSNASAMTNDDCVKSYQRYLDFTHRCVSNEVTVVFIRIPTAWVVRPADVSRVAHKFSPNPYATREATAEACSALNSNGVIIINPTDALIEHDRETRMYNLYDIHLTVAGNKVVAEEALPVIQRVVGQHQSAGP